MENALIPGEPRLGWFVDGNPDTERVAVMLQDTGTAIEITIPLKGMFSKDDPYRTWWSDGMHFVDDPNGTKHSYKPPRVLLVEDAHGPVVLVGCHSKGFRSNLHVGQGQIVANFAVLGGSHLRYEKIDGLRTEVPGLAAWTRLSSMEVQVATDVRHRIKSVQMKLVDAQPVSLARPLNLEMRSSWRTEQPTGKFLAYEGVELDTSVRQPRTWDEHFLIHGAVLDLVSIAAWRSFGISSVQVRRIDDPERNIAGSSMGDRWLRVSTHRLPEHRPWANEPRFLFPYQEIGPRGVARWFRLRKTYGRVVGPLVNILRSEEPWGHSSVVQSGIALEHLGYLIDVDKNDGIHLNNRKQMNFKPGLQVILDDMKVKPFPDHSAWIDRADAAYMGLKHPDRPEPDTLVMMNTLRENLLILRFWIGLQLGARPESLMDALANDTLAYAFTLSD